VAQVLPLSSQDPLPASLQCEHTEFLNAAYVDCSAHSGHSANEKVANESMTASFNKQAMSTVNGSSNVSTHQHSSTRYEEHIAYEKTEEYYDEYLMILLGLIGIAHTPFVGGAKLNHLALF